MQKFWTENFGTSTTVPAHTFGNALEQLELWKSNTVQRKMAQMLLLPRDLSSNISLHTFGRFLDLLGPREELVQNLQEIISQKWFFWGTFGSRSSCLFSGRNA